MLEIKKPTKQDILNILECLANGKLKRRDVVDWQRAVMKTFDYYGPGVCTVPLGVEEGYWDFVTFSELLRCSEIPSQSGEFFVRNKDFEEFASCLRQEDLCEANGRLSYLRNHQVSKPKTLFASAVQFEDSDIFIRNSMRTYRGIMDSLGVLQECSLFNYQGKAFLIILMHDHQPGIVSIECEYDNKEIVANLLIDLGVSFESPLWISDTLDNENCQLSRLDDNANSFIMSEHSTFIEAELVRHHYQQKGHKQTYEVIRG